MPLHAPVAGTAPALRITPHDVPVDFGWNQDVQAPKEWGLDFQVTYVHGGPPLSPGDVVFIRANFLLMDPSPLEDRLAGRGGEEDAAEHESLLALYLDAWTSGALGLQVADAGEANHVELSADPALTTEGVWKMAPPRISNPQFRVIPVHALAEVRPGDRFTVAVRRACSAAARNPGGIASNANEHAFVAAVGRRRTGGSGHAREWQVVNDVRGGWMLPTAASVVHAVAPSQAQAGLPVQLRLAVLDDVDNRVHGWRGTLQLSCTDPAAGFPAAVTLGADEDGAASVAVTLHTAGFHRFTVRALGSEFSTGPILVAAEAPARQVLWGDYHVHSWRCDGTGEPVNLLAYARETAFLDWAALTSHDAPPWPFAGAVSWRDIAARVNAAQRPGFVTLPAFEWTSTASGDEDDSTFETNADGHRIVLGRDWNVLLHPFLPTWKHPDSDETWKLHRELIRRDEGSVEPRFMVVPHDLMCSNWWNINAECDDCTGAVTPEEQERYVPLAQVYSPLHGNHESPQEDGELIADGTTAEAAEDGMYLREWRPHSRYYGQPDELAGYVNGLKYGGIYGVVAGSDSHAGRPGSFVWGALTAVLAEEHSRDGIFDALRARHTFATSGHRLLMELWHPLQDGGRVIMGDRVDYDAADPPAPTLCWRVASPLPIRRVRLVRVRGPLEEEKEEVRQGVTDGEPPPDPWQFVRYVFNDDFAGGARPLEVSGSYAEAEGVLGEWPYVSYFLVVEHENTRRHSRDVPDENGHDAGYHQQDRGWTSPIFFRCRGAELPLPCGGDAGAAR
ncbi:MAG TPA: DUF3604 domain-containing protein [Longimicrobium sp.]|nr:DUF3604 domain-containing protein [Longimicrobium sp.]